MRTSAPKRSNEQKEGECSIETQKERLLAFCKAHDWQAVGLYSDYGHNGSNLDRPGIKKLISEISSFDLVLVVRLSCLSCSQRDVLYLIEDVFFSNNVDFVSMSEAFDTSIPFGRATVSVLSDFFRLEHDSVKDPDYTNNVSPTHNKFFRSDAYFPIGYDYGEDSQLHINEYEAAQVKKIFALYLDGKSPEKIAAQLREEGFTNRYGSWSGDLGRALILRVLTSELYLGISHSNGVAIENTHPAIIDRETFEKATEIRRKHQAFFGNPACKSKYLLVGLLYCARCGARYGVKHNYGGYKYYACYSRAGTVKRMAKAEHCNNKNWRLDELDALIEREISRLLYDPTYYENLVKGDEEKQNLSAARLEATMIRNKIFYLDKRIERMMELYKNKRLPTNVASSRIDKFRSEKKALEAELASFKLPKLPRNYDRKAFSAYLSDFATVWQSASSADRRQIASTLIKRILLDGDNVEIEWAFLE